MQNNITCDKCNETFNIKLKKQKRGVSTEINYFTCPKCKHKYIFSVIDKDCRKLQQEIRKLYQSKTIPAKDYADGKITEEEYIAEVNMIKRTIEEKQIPLKEKMDKLIETYK